MRRAGRQTACPWYAGSRWHRHRLPTDTAEAALPQPAGQHPLLAGDHRCTGMQRPGTGVWPVVAEEHRIALHRRALHARIREGGGTPAGRGVEVGHQGGHTLAAVAQGGLGPCSVGVKVIVVRLVLGARPVIQHLQGFGMVDRPAQQVGDALLDAGHQRGHRRGQIGTFGGARLVGLVLPGGCVEGGRSLQAAACGGDQLGTLPGRKHIAQQHHPRVHAVGQHLDLAAVHLDQRRAVEAERHGHRHRRWQALQPGLLLGVPAQHRIDSDAGLLHRPAGFQQRGKQLFGTGTGTGLVNQPTGEFSGQR